MALPTISELAISQARKQEREPHSDEVSLLAFDPGHTTGWAAFTGFELKASGQINTEDIDLATQAIQELIDEHKPSIIVLEEYRIYRWRTQHHAGSDLPTARVIGCMETLAYVQHIDLYKQPAQLAKGFCKDAKLRAWGVYKQGEKHARDAIRHGIYFMIAGPVKGKGSKSRVG